MSIVSLEERIRYSSLNAKAGSGMHRCPHYITFTHPDERHCKFMISKKLKSKQQSNYCAHPTKYRDCFRYILFDGTLKSSSFNSKPVTVYVFGEKETMYV